MPKRQSESPPISPEDFRELLARYRTPCVRRSVLQLVTTVIPYVLMWVVMWYSLFVSYWLTLALAVVQAGLSVRLFVIHHDCSHGSFFRSRLLNDSIGFVFAALTLTPYRAWRWSHARHHASSGDLDRRGHGDVHTLTVREYLGLSPVRRLAYRVFRNPVVLFFVIPAVLFALIYRFPNTLHRSGPNGSPGVMWTNLALVCGVLLASWTIGLAPFLMLVVPVVLISSTFGVWLFYVQHQFEDTYWAHGDEWDRSAACLRGSSYFALPRVLEWFTANIGFHHIHHLDSRIPNYRLKECYRNEPVLHRVRRLTILQSFTCIFSKLWDEDRQCMVGYPRLA